MKQPQKKKWYESWWFLAIVVSIILGQISKCNKEKCNDFEGLYHSECSLNNNVRGHVSLYIDKECSAIETEKWVVLGVNESSEPEYGKLEPVEGNENTYTFVGESGFRWRMVINGENITLFWNDTSCNFVKQH
jgi:hypothetical protein